MVEAAAEAEAEVVTAFYFCTMSDGCGPSHRVCVCVCVGLWRVALAAVMSIRKRRCGTRVSVCNMSVWDARGDAWAVAAQRSARSRGGFAGWVTLPWRGGSRVCSRVEHVGDIASRRRPAANLVHR